MLKYILANGKRLQGVVNHRNEPVLASRPVPGAVAVFNRGRLGGHVAIVHHVRPDGTVIYLNPSSRRQAWQVGPYRKQPIAYRVAGF